MPLLPSGPVQNWRVSAARKGSETPRVFSEAGSEQPQTAVYPGGPLRLLEASLCRMHRPSSVLWVPTRVCGGDAVSRPVLWQVFLALSSDLLGVVEQLWWPWFIRVSPSQVDCSVDCSHASWGCLCSRPRMAAVPT